MSSTITTNTRAHMLNQNQRRVLQIVNSMSDVSAGPTYYIRKLSETLASRGCRVDIHSLKSRSDISQVERDKNEFVYDYSHLPIVKHIFHSKELYSVVMAAGREEVLYHSHGLWRMCNIYPSNAVRRWGGELIVSPHGMLGKHALQYSRLKKRIFSLIWQNRAFESAYCFHAASDQELEDIRSSGIKKPVAVIPLGIDVYNETEILRAKCRRDSRHRTLLYLGRLHRQKGLLNLLEAWAGVESMFPDWDIRIVGPSQDGYLEELLSSISRLSLKRASISGPLFGSERDTAYREADLVILPSFGENFGMVVAEALANGTPVICTKNAPWAALASNDCGWWIDNDRDSLRAGIIAALSMPRSALDAMGRNGRRLMEDQFSWAKVTDDMQALYNWTLSKGDRPSFVETGV
jgi:glycosyltransferase involved in cell wall biosynthesis